MTKYLCQKWTQTGQYSCLVDYEPRLRRLNGFTLVELLTVIGVLGVLAAIIYPAFSATRGKAYQTQDASNLRSFGVARALYEEDHGPIIDTVVLVTNKIVPLQCVVSASDPTLVGYANIFRRTDGNPGQVTVYKDSYLPLSSAGSPYASRLILSSSNPGWLVAFSGSHDYLNGTSLGYDGPETPILQGTYLRLMLDTSVVVRHCHVRHHYPSPQIENFQNPLWFFTDDDDAAEPGHLATSAE